jgi:phosphonate transport system substrate-binding protein
MAMALFSPVKRARRGVLLLGLCAWVGWTSAPALAAGATYTVSVVPQFSAAEVNRVWAPLLERLSQDTGQHFVLKLSKDIPAFEAELLAGTPDLAYMNPYHQVMARRGPGYVPLVRDTTLLTGILVVRKDSPIQSVQELKGQQVAFPAPNAFGASLWIRAHLAEQDKVAITPLYAKTHTNAYRQALMGKTAAAGGIRSTLEREPDEVRAALRILMETSGAAPHPLSAHPRVPVAVQQAVTQSWLKMAQDPAMRALLADIPMPQPIKADYNHDYLPLERLKVDKYVE